MRHKEQLFEWQAKHSLLQLAILSQELLLYPSQRQTEYAFCTYAALQDQ